MKGWQLLLLGVMAAIILMGRRLIPRSIEVMARAIMEFEGYFPGSLSQRNNNPGNLIYAGQTGAIGKDDRGFAIFEDFAAGWNALVNQLKLAFENKSRFYNSSMTLLDFFRSYAPRRTDNPVAYAAYVAGRLGVTVTTTLEELQ